MSGYVDIGQTTKQRKTSSFYKRVKVFSATMAAARNNLGDVVTAWIHKNRKKVDIADKLVLQSSDRSFHCLTIVLFYTSR